MLVLVGCSGGNAAGGSAGDGETPCVSPVRNVISVAYDQVSGVDPNLLSVDVYRLDQSCASRPVLFWVHGGGWSVGDKANNMDQKASLAARNGWVLVSVNYRLSTPATPVMWPTHGNDVNAAISYVLDHASDYGIDPERVGVMGHSAGGQLAAIVTVDDSYQRETIDCLVALDTEGYDLNSKMDSNEGQAKEMVVRAFGSDPAVLAGASPTLVAAAGSAPIADALIVARGSDTRRRLASEFHDAMLAAGSISSIVVADGYTHAQVNEVIGDPNDTVVSRPTESFLKTCLAKT